MLSIHDATNFLLRIVIAFDSHSLERHILIFPVSSGICVLRMTSSHSIAAAP